MPAGEWKLKQFSVFYQLRHIFDDNTIIDDEIRMKKTPERKRNKRRRFKNIYISTDQPGLYENFGFTFKEKLKDRWDGETLVYKRPIY